MAKATKEKAAVKAKKPVAKKVAVKKTAARKALSKKATTKKAKRKPSAALLKAMTPSALLAEIVGAKPIPRGQIIKKVWDYIKKFGLQDKVNKRVINADEKLKKIFGGKSAVDMFEMSKHVGKHIS